MPNSVFNDFNFDTAFKITSTSLNVIRTHPFLTQNKHWRCAVISLTVANIGCLFLLCNSIFLHDLRNGNYPDITKNFAMLIICMNSNIKYYIMLYYKHSLGYLIETINRDYEAATHFSEDERNVILEYSKKANKVCHFCLGVALLTGIVFPMKAFYLMLYYYLKGEPRLVPMFDLTFPYFIEKYKENVWLFCGFFGVCLFFALFSILVYISFEPLIPIFTLHICGQLELLMLRMSKAISDSKTEEEIKDELKDINMKLQELNIFMSHVQRNFRVLMEFNMKTTTVILPCNAFRIVDDFRSAGIINIEFIVLLFTANIHFFTPCYFCDVLIESSKKFRQAIYSCRWENCRSRRIRIMILLMLIRADKPFSVSTIFYFVCLNTYSTMCRQSYAIFNLMSAAWT